MPRYSKEENIRWHNSQPAKRMAAGLILRDKNGNVLLVKPNYRDDWNLVGGVVDENESPRDAAVRELEEELGLRFDPEDLRLALVAHRAGLGGYHDSMYFVFDSGELPRDQIGNIQLQEDELDEYRFIDPAELPKFLDTWKTSYVQHVLKDPLKTWYIENTEVG